MQGIDLAKSRNDIELEGLLLGNAGNACVYLGDHAQALDYMETALKIARAVGDPNAEARWLVGLGNVYISTGQYSRASEKYKNAAQLAQAGRDTLNEISATANLGATHTFLGEYEEAIDQFLLAMELSKRIGNRRAEAIVLGGIGSIYGYLGNYAEALASHERALTIAREIGDVLSSGKWIANIGVDQWHLGNYNAALESYNEAMRIMEKVGDKAGIALFLTNIGVIHADLGDYRVASEYYERAIEVAQLIGDRRGEGVGTYNLGYAAWALGNYTQAIERIERAINIFVEIQDKKNEGQALAGLGLVHSAMGDYTIALEYSTSALQISEEIGYKYAAGEQLNNLGELSLAANGHLQAQEHFTRALTIGDTQGMRKIQWRAHTGLARVAHVQGASPRALAHYRLAVQAVETVRGEVEAEELRSIFVGSQMDVYEGLIGLLCELHHADREQGYDQEAFQYAERAKARSLVDILVESRAEIRRGVSPALLDRERRTIASISKYQTELRALGLAEEKAEKLREQLREAEERFEELQLELKRSSPVYVSLKYPAPLTMSEVQEAVLESGERMLVYSLGEEYSYLWAIDRDGSRLHRLPARGEIEARVQECLDVIGRPPRPSIRPGPFGRTLYEMLVQPAEDHLREGSRLIVVPDGILHYLPFEALVRESDAGVPRYLVEVVDISYAPSASVLGLIRDDSLTRPRDESLRLLALGDPVFGTEDEEVVEEHSQRGLYEEHGFRFQRLPYSGEEVTAIASLYPEESRLLCVREEAKEERVKEVDLTRYGRIHFATHGLIDELVPGRSCIVLTLDEDPAEDGFLQMREIFNLELDADLVVLSACQTGRGKLIRGEGLIGLSRAFFYAGARSLLVSLWSVNDKSTAGFMEQFYRSLNGGSTKAEALRLAKLSMIKGDAPALRHPYYWAPFVLIGESG